MVEDLIRHDYEPEVLRCNRGDALKTFAKVETSRGLFPSR